MNRAKTEKSTTYRTPLYDVVMFWATIVVIVCVSIALYCRWM